MEAAAAVVEVEEGAVVVEAEEVRHWFVSF